MDSPRFMPLHPNAERGVGFPDLELVPFSALHEGNAMRVHEQSLDRLAARGGMDWIELWGNVMRVNPMRVTRPTPRECAWFVAGFIQGSEDRRESNL